MKKADRQKVYDKYGGKCAYCGCDLVNGWHVDELLPVVRGWKYQRDDKGRVMVNDKGKDIKTSYMEFPERLHIDNQMPACASCNIQKHSQSLEGFRQNISGFINSLNKYHNQYKFAKRYGLVEETGKTVVFYFETLNPNTQNKKV
jgi:hypothetical protein